MILNDMFSEKTVLWYWEFASLSHWKCEEDLLFKTSQTYCYVVQLKWHIVMAKKNKLSCYPNEINITNKTDKF